MTPWFTSHFHHAADRVVDWLALTDKSTGTLVDFGCGGGITTLALALRFPRMQVVGLDPLAHFQDLAAIAEAEIALSTLPENLRFDTIEAQQPLSEEFSADYLYSWSVFEHIPNDILSERLAELYRTLKSGGRMLIQIEPLYYSPFGSHLRKYVSEPWAHLSWSKERLLECVEGGSQELPEGEKGHNYRRRTPQELKKFLVTEYLSLNKITAEELMDRIAEAGFSVLRVEKKYLDMEPPQELLARLPSDVLRNNAVFVLSRK